MKVMNIFFEKKNNGNRRGRALMSIQKTACCALKVEFTYNQTEKIL